MSHPMVVEVGAGGEPFTTDPALMRLLSAVYTTVGVQWRRRRESLTTDVTGVRFLSWKKTDKKWKLDKYR